jgi:hypothetical protein
MCCYTSEGHNLTFFRPVTPTLYHRVGYIQVVTNRKSPVFTTVSQNGNILYVNCKDYVKQTVVGEMGQVIFAI